MNRSSQPILMFAALALLSACTNQPRTATSDNTNEPALHFMTELHALCGQAFAGRITANEPPSPNDPFAGKSLIMHVRECTPGHLRIPFHVGDDRSRTWVVSRIGSRLRLKHDHRHRDGSEDQVTQYGGDSIEAGTSMRQKFPVDAFSRALFERRAMSVSTTNTWALEIQPGQRFVYELERPGRWFRVEFDLQHPVPVPPAPWGAGDRASD